MSRNSYEISISEYEDIISSLNSHADKVLRLSGVIREETLHLLAISEGKRDDCWKEKMTLLEVIGEAMMPPRSGGRRT